jgi:endoglucanase
VRARAAFFAKELLVSSMQLLASTTMKLGWLTRETRKLRNITTLVTSLSAVLACSDGEAELPAFNPAPPSSGSGGGTATLPSQPVAAAGSAGGASMQTRPLSPAPIASGGTGGTGGTGSVPATSGGNPFSGKTLASDGGAVQGALDSASGEDRELLAKIADKPAAYWLVGGDPSQAGSIASGAGASYPVLVAYNIPGRDCGSQSAGGVGGGAEYRGWIDGMASSLQGKQAAIILEPDALALGCVPDAEALIRYAVTSLRKNPDVAVYIDAGHSNWVPAGDMAARLRGSGIEEATGFALNVSNFEPTQNLINFGKQISSQVGDKPFVVDTSRNGRGPRGSFCNPAGAGLGEPPTTSTGDPLVHAFLWVKRPGESDGACGECGSVPAGQFCTDYAIELARNAIF